MIRPLHGPIHVDDPDEEDERGIYRPRVPDGRPLVAGLYATDVPVERHRRRSEPTRLSAPVVRDPSGVHRELVSQGRYYGEVVSDYLGGAGKSAFSRLVFQSAFPAARFAEAAGRSGRDAELLDEPAGGHRVTVFHAARPGAPSTGRPPRRYPWMWKGKR